MKYQAMGQAIANIIKGIELACFNLYSKLA
jgi:hypothetical protein